MRRLYVKQEEIVEREMAILTALTSRMGTIAARIALIATAATFLLGVGIVPLVSSDHAAEARARRVRKTIPIEAVCAAPDAAGYCASAFFADVRTTKVFKVAFVPDASLCSPVEVVFTVRDGTTEIGNFGPFLVAPGVSTDVVNAGPVSSGSGGVKIAVRDAAGGCEGFIGDWSGTLKATISKRVRR